MDLDLDHARQTIRTALEGSLSPTVLWSAGKDSMLLLHLVREVRQDIPVVWFRTGQSEIFARRIIQEWNLTAFSWAPADVYMLSPSTMIHEYSFGSDRLPLLLDLQDGSRCSLTRFTDRTPHLDLPFDLLLVGWKDTDEHWVKGDAPLAKDGFMIDHARVVAPIRHMTDAQVRAAIVELKVPYEQVDDELPLCTHCMTAGEGEVYCPEVGHFIPRHQWEQDLSLTGFRERFGLEANNG